MKKAYIILLIFVLFISITKAQKQLTIDQIPKTLFGDYQDQYGRWDFDFTPEFFNISGYPVATVQGATVEGNVYTINLKANEKEKGNYKVKVKQIARDTIKICDLNDTSVYYTYTRLGSDKIIYPPLSHILDKVKGKWYYNDGSNKMYLDFKDDHVVAPDGKWYYRTYSFYQNWMPQINVAGPDDKGTLLHFYDMTENYVSIEFRGKEFQKVKRFSDIPDEPSIALKELPFSIDGTWYSCADDSQVQFEKYFVNPGTKKLLAKKMTKENDVVIIKYSSNDIIKTLRIKQTVDSKYISITNEKGIVTIYRNDKTLAAGMPIDLDAKGDWFNLETGKIQASISEGKLTIDGKDFTYNSILFDGQNYKFYKDKTLQASLQKQSKNIIAFTIAGNKQINNLKRNPGLPSYLVLDTLPDDIYQNWLHPTTGEWLAGFMKDKVIYKTKNWEYGKMVYSLNGGYQVNLKGVDTVCSVNDKGEKLCRLVERHDSIKFILKNNRYTFNINKYNNVALVNTFQEVDYQPKTQLPDPKTGTAVLCVQYLGNPKDIAGQSVKVSTNNIWFMNQLSYATTFDNKGYAKLEVPMSQAQPVYATVKNYGRIFLSPGDTLYAAFDGVWANRLERVIWMGKQAQINYDICKYDLDYWGMAEFTRESNTLLNKPIDKYKEARVKLTNKIATQDKKYFEKNICSPGFIELTNIDIQVDEWNDLMRYRWLPERFRRNTVQFPPEYFNFLKEIDYSNKKYWYSENMAWFLYEMKNWFTSVNQTEKTSISIDEIIQNILSSNIEVPDSTKKAMLVCLDQRKIKLGDKLISEITEELHKSFKVKIDSVKNSLENKKDFDIVVFYRKNQTKYNPEEFEIIANWMNSSKEIYTKDIISFINNYMNKTLADQRKQKSFNNFELINASEDTKKMFTIMMSLSDFNSTLGEMNEKKIRNDYANLQTLNIPPSVLEIVHKKYEETLAIIAQPMPGNINLETVAQGSGDEFMAKLAQKHAGKVVYIDFWAPWCGPCKSEFPYAPQLKKNFAGKDVVFVYICGSGEKDSWENCIKQFKVNGDHYYIEAKTYNGLQEKYSINSIPRFMIMDKQGKIVDFSSSRPSNLEETSRRLNSYL
jgi:thiol-disulfide isomerase/thioredoxin